jgi:N-acetylmuramoyl-L-alanine amidase
MPLIEVRASHARPRRGPTTALILPALILPALILFVAFHGLGALKAQKPPVPAPPVAPGKPELPPIPTPPASGLAIQPAFSVVIDAAHGGANTGARIAADLIEKNITLALSTRLRAALTARGITVIMTRESDAEIPSSQRAGIANHALASACLILHATATGSGVHLFTSSLAPVVGVGSASASTAATGLVPWQTAQAAWVTRSLRLSSEINSALGQAGIPTTLGVASVQPLDNLACPAVTIEVAPPTMSAASQSLALSDAKYQQRIVDALAAAMMEWRADWKQQP